MNNNRPLSPHLQVYRLPLTGLISISHRMTGVLLSLGLILFAFMLLALAAGEADYLTMQSLLGLPFVRLLYVGIVFAWIFHLCHGVRHLVWDAGASFDRDTMNRYAVIELIASAVLTIAIFLIF